MTIDEMIEQIVERKIEEKLNQLNQKQEREQLVLKTEVRRIYGVGVATISRWVENGLNEYRDGRKIYYSLNEIQDFLKGSKYEKRKR